MRYPPVLSFCSVKATYWLYTQHTHTRAHTHAQFESVFKAMENRVLFRQYLAASMTDELYEFYTLIQQFRMLDCPEMRSKQVFFLCLCPCRFLYFLYLTVHGDDL